MLQIRKAKDRGYADRGWLKSYHTFSFADYYDPRFIHFSHLRVINEDWVVGGHGFGKHPHDNMEILTYVLEGAVEHQDSMGNRTQLRAGEFQIMSAGSGIFHSEMNPHHSETLHLFQIWVIPNEKNITPRYEQKSFADKNGATLLLSPNADDNSFKVHQDMKLWRYQLKAGDNQQIELNPNRHYWLQMVKGQLLLNNNQLVGSDAVGISQESIAQITAEDETEFLLFDLV